MVETEELTMCLMNLINGRGSFMITMDFLFKFMFWKFVIHLPNAIFTTKSNITGKNIGEKKQRKVAKHYIFSDDYETATNSMLNNGKKMIALI